MINGCLSCKVANVLAVFCSCYYSIVSKCSGLLPLSSAMKSICLMLLFLLLCVLVTMGKLWIPCCFKNMKYYTQKCGWPQPCSQSSKGYWRPQLLFRVGTFSCLWTTELLVCNIQFLPNIKFVHYAPNCTSVMPCLRTGYGQTLRKMCASLLCLCGKWGCHMWHPA